MKKILAWLILVLVVAAGNLFGDSAVDYQGVESLAQSLAQRTEGKVFRDVVAPHWLPDNRHLWYCVTTGPDTHEYVLVDAETGEIKRSTNAEQLGVPENERIATSNQRSLAPKRTTHTGGETAIRLHNTTDGPVEVFWVNESGDRRPYGRLQPGETREFHTYAGHVWLVTDSPGNPLGFFEATLDELEVEIDGPPVKVEPPRRHDDSDRSPDDQFSVRFENQNAVLVSASGETTALTTNGTLENPYRGPVVWSPDSRHCVVLSVQEVPRHVVTIVESSPPDQLQPKLISYDYFKPGDALPQVQPMLIDVARQTATVIPNDLFSNAFTPDGEPAIRWSPGGGEFYFDYNQRGHQLYRIIAVNATNRVVRTVVEERSKTFIDYDTKTWREWLDDSGELLWMSERDGWAHLWLYDLATGTVKNQVTCGDWVVREVLKVDAAKRQVWFLASGVRSGEDPYHHQLCRVNFDGSGFVQLTKAMAITPWNFRRMEGISSTAGRAWISRPSRNSAAATPANSLARSNGPTIRNWSRPAGRCRNGSWPKAAMAGRTSTASSSSHRTSIPRRNIPWSRKCMPGRRIRLRRNASGGCCGSMQIAELGFIVVQADGMGTNNRGKAFHDVCWKNLKDAGFPDRIAWIRAAAENAAVDGFIARRHLWRFRWRPKRHAGAA